jgi:hypothetical protein
LLLEHTYRLAKNTLGWDKAALRDPAQVSRWTWLIIAAITQLRLARPVAEDHRQRWERRRKHGKLTPGRGLWRIFRDGVGRGYGLAVRAGGFAWPCFAGFATCRVGDGRGSW